MSIYIRINCDSRGAFLNQEIRIIVPAHIDLDQIQNTGSFKVVIFDKKKDSQYL